MSRFACCVLLGLFFSDSQLLWANDKPGQILNLSHWRLTLPADVDQSGQPDEIEAWELQEFFYPGCFTVDPKSNAVMFRAACGGVTTKGSTFPRCELREMTDSGKEEASWSTDDSQPHTMQMHVAITKTPPRKKHVVCAQIHDADDDLIMVRLEGKKLFLERNDLPTVMLTKDYELGTTFDLTITAAAGTVRVVYNKKESLIWPVSRKGCYFKAGCYTQSNPERGDEVNAYGEVQIYELEVSHHAP